MTNDIDFAADVRHFTPAFRWVKKWCCINKFDFFDNRSFKDLKRALKFFRDHDGYFLRKVEVFE